MSNNIPLVVKKTLESIKEKLDTSGYIQFNKSIELKNTFVSERNKNFNFKWVDGLQLLPEGVKVWFSSEDTTDIIWEHLHLIEDENLINEIKKTFENMLEKTTIEKAQEYINIERTMHERGIEIVRELLKEQNITEDNALEFKGLERLEAREKIVTKLDALGFIEKIEDHTNQIGKCYRCGNIIEPYVSLQWFVKAEIASGAIEKVNQDKLSFQPL